MGFTFKVSVSKESVLPDAQMVKVSRIDQNLGIIVMELDASPLRIFSKNGEMWEAAFGNENGIKYYPDSKGMQYINRLLRYPGQTIHAPRLEDGEFAAHDLGNMSTDENEFQRKATITKKWERNFDRKTENGVKQRLAALSLNDNLSPDEQREKVDLEKYLKGICSKTVPESEEKARKAVSNAIGRALMEIKKSSPDLYDHLKTCLRLGALCSYCPESNVEWVL